MFGAGFDPKAMLGGLKAASARKKANKAVASSGGKDHVCIVISSCSFT